MNTYKLGKKPVRLDPRTLKMAKYLPKALPPLPAKFSCWARVSDWGMMLNDNIGDCTCASAGHEILQWTSYASAPFRPTDAAILKAYEDVSGYNPADPSTDRGADILSVLNYWRKQGIGGHVIDSYVSVATIDELKYAISLFGSAHIGIALPISAQSQECWSVSPTGLVGDGTPASWGGHDVPVVGWSDRALAVVTWGGIKYMTWNFYKAYCEEAYAILSKDWIEARGVSPTDFNIDQLRADLTAIAG